MPSSASCACRPRLLRSATCTASSAESGPLASSAATRASSASRSASVRAHAASLPMRSRTASPDRRRSRRRARRWRSRRATRAPRATAARLRERRERSVIAYFALGAAGARPGTASRAGTGERRLRSLVGLARIDLPAADARNLVVHDLPRIHGRRPRTTGSAREWRLVRDVALRGLAGRRRPLAAGRSATAADASVSSAAAKMVAGIFIVEPQVFDTLRAKAILPNASIVRSFPTPSFGLTATLQSRNERDGRRRRRGAECAALLDPTRRTAS